MTRRFHPLHQNNVLLTLLTGIAALVSLSSCQTSEFDFDCRRLGVDCGQGNKCNVNDGKCDCVAATTAEELNYRCQNETDFPCRPDKYGNNCTMNRVQVFCSGDRMFLNVNPEGMFQGVIYPFGKNGVPACQFKLDTQLPGYVGEVPGIDGYALDLPFLSEECGDAVPLEEEIEGVKQATHTRHYIVQYNNMFQSALDQKLSVACVLSEKNFKVEGKVNEVVPGNSNFKNIDIDQEVNANVVEFKLRTADLDSLPDKVNLGQEILLELTLGQGTGFVDFSLSSCTANNTEEDEVGGGYRSVVFLENNCPTSAGQALFKNGVSKTQDENGVTKMTVSISAFMFLGTTARIGFVCDVTLCGDANRDLCKKNSCDGVTSEIDKRQEAEALAAAEAEEARRKAEEEAAAKAAAEAEANANNSTTTNANNGTDLIDGDVNNGDTIDSNTTTPEAIGNNIDATTTNNTGGEDSADTGDEAAANTGDNPENPADNGGGENPPPVDGGNGDVPDELPNRRRKRANDDGDLDPRRQVYQEVTVVDPLAPKQETRIQFKDTDCMNEDDVITVIALLASLVLILFVTTLVLICHVMKTRGKKLNEKLYYGYNNGGKNKMAATAEEDSSRRSFSNNSWSNNTNTNTNNTTDTNRGKNNAINSNGAHHSISTSAPSTYSDDIPMVQNGASTNRNNNTISSSSASSSAPVSGYYSYSSSSSSSSNHQGKNNNNASFNIPRLQIARNHNNPENNHHMVQSQQQEHQRGRSSGYDNHSYKA